MLAGRSLGITVLCPAPIAYNQSAKMFQTEEMIIHNEANVWKFMLLWAHQILCCMFFTCYLTCYLWQCENRYCYYARIELTIHGLIVIWDRQVCKWMSQELPQELFFFFGLLLNNSILTDWTSNSTSIAESVAGEGNRGRNSKYNFLWKFQFLLWISLKINYNLLNILFLKEKKVAFATGKFWQYSSRF